jgi:geranylgeranyl diphosphate synthase type I
MAFQAIDDYLGIWGDPAKLGKSVESDLISKKKTLPVVFGLQSIPRFSELWMQSKINAEDACEMARMLEVVGAKDYVLAQAKRHTDNAFKALHAAGKNNEAREAIQSLASGLLKRDY